MFYDLVRSSSPPKWGGHYLLTEGKQKFFELELGLILNYPLDC
jgi:hypothetical protein